MLILMGTAVLIPETVTELDVTAVLSKPVVTVVKLNASGVVSANTVVTEKIPVTPPMVNTAWVVVLGVADAKRVSVTV